MIPHKPKNQYSLIQNDVLNWAKSYKGKPFHCLLCDPPYHLTSITKRFGKPGSAPAKVGVYNRGSKGFMGTDWDGTGESGNGIAFDPETWEALGEHLYPGAFGMAFASSRGWHRLAVAIEDAGFIIHPSIFGWCFLSGFPKATRIKNEIFEGYRYGLQAMKPALEPIILFQKPYEGRPVDCIATTGAGALNIDRGRIGTNPGIRTNGSANNIYGDLSYTGGEEWEGSDLGRWPANLILDEAGAELLDHQSGDRPAGGSKTGNEPSPKTKNVYGEYANEARQSYDDSGGASRMFFKSDWQYEILEQLENADPLRYESKVSTTEREAGLDGPNPHPTLKPLSLCKYLATLLLPPNAYAPRRILCPFAGTGSEMIGAILAGWEEVTGIEMTPAYIPIAEKRLAWWSQWPGWGQTDIDKILTAVEPNKAASPVVQMEMF